MRRVSKRLPPGGSSAGGGLNKLLMDQPELVMVLSLLQAAMTEYNNPKFNFHIYRKLILDAGAEVDKLKEV